MKKHLFALATMLLSIATAMAQQIGEWRIYPACHNAQKSVTAGSRIYVLSDGALYSYDPQDEELRIYDKVAPLSDNGIALIEYCAAQKELVIVYQNGNIDLLSDDGTVYNIVDLKNKTLSSKETVSLNVEGDTAYISGSFGVLLLNIKKREFINTYLQNNHAYYCIRYHGSLLAFTKSGIYMGDQEKNLLDHDNWEKITANVIDEAAIIGDRIILLERKNGIHELQPETKKLKTLVKGKYQSLQPTTQGKLATYNSSELLLFDSPEEYKSYPLNGHCQHLNAWAGNTLWSSEGSRGLVRYELGDEGLTQGAEGIIPDSPRRNYCEYLTFADEKLLVAGGCTNYFDKTFYEGTLMSYDGNRWSEFEEDEIAEITNELYVNVTSVVQDPSDPAHHFASSFGHGLYEFRDYKMINHYNHSNSPLISALGTGMYSDRYVRVPRIAYDRENNLWMTNCSSDSAIKVLKADGSWCPLYYSELSMLPTLTDIVFDGNRVWVASLQAPAGIFCADTRGTLLDTSDDQCKFVSTTFTNQDGGKETVYALYCMALDRDGTLWVGTDQGLYTLRTPSYFFNDDYTFTQVKVPRNDGTNYADYLLDGVYISAIAVDGANRKWIGTQGNGLYVVSADGTEEVHHFTAENSPLISNNIVSIAPHPTTSEVFIGTDAGIVSYVSNATASKDDLKESNIHTYPNPVRPDYRGPISITGLTFGSHVKIVDTAGRLVNEGTSQGGLYTWDGCDGSGNRVASGIYYVLVGDAEESNGAATKILFIK